MHFLKRHIILTFLTILATLVPTMVHAAVSIYPYALDLDANSNKRIVSIRIANTSEESKTIRISLIDQLQKQDGSFDLLPAEEVAPKSAKAFMTFSPHQFELGPKEAQKVNVSRKPLGDLPDGDYVTHLKIQEVSTPKPAEEKKKDPKGMEVNVTLLYSLVVPIYLKKGETAGKADLVSAKLIRNAKQEQEVSVKLNKEGEKYFRGKLEVISEGKTVGIIKNIRIYPNVAERTASIPLDKDAPNLSGKEVQVRYVDEADKVISEGSYKL